MNQPQYKHAEQADGSETITIWLDNDYSVDVKETDVLNWIDLMGINVHKEGNGLVSDPNGTETEVETRVEEYLGDNWETVMPRYYNEVIVGGFDKHLKRRYVWRLIRWAIM